VKWDRLGPNKKRARLSAYVPKKGSVEFERANMQHYLLEEEIVRLCRANNIVALTNRHIDVLAQAGSVSVIFEMKACTQTEISTPLRQAVYQLIEYRYFYRIKLSADVRACVVIAHRPRDKSEWLIGYLEHLRIGLIWKNEGGRGFGCTELTKTLIGDVLPQISGWSASASMPGGDLQAKAQLRRV